MQSHWRTVKSELFLFACQVGGAAGQEFLDRCFQEMLGREE